MISPLSNMSNYANSPYTYGQMSLSGPSIPGAQHFGANTVNGSSPQETDPTGKGRVQDSNEECQTCKNRKYQDGSDEMVSFKSPKHVSPEAAATAVRSHEQEHVSNAYKKAAEGNGKVVNASVSIHTSICPECGRSYVSGGTTHTQIKYYNEENPYQQGLKIADQAKYAGMNTDFRL